MDRSLPSYQTYFQTEYCPNDIIQEEDSNDEDLNLRYQSQIVNNPRQQLLSKPLF